MRTCGFEQTTDLWVGLRRQWPIASLLLAILVSSSFPLAAQTTDPSSISEQVKKLTDALARTQAQLEQSQHELDEMRTLLNAMQRQLMQSQSATPPTVSSTPLPSSSSTSQEEAANLDAAIKELGEQQAMQESQIAVHEQTKVESESKYPVRVTGLILLNGFVNTGAVDMPATPTLALQGPGSTGASVSQTVLGFDARGPHLFGARSYADLRVDFDGSSQTSYGNSGASYTGYGSSQATLLRLRTAHAVLQWNHTKAYFALDRPILSPDTPTSLTAVAEPALAWSGNLWTWNPQLGVTEDLPVSRARSVQLQAALIDVGDAPLSPAGSVGTPPPSGAEQSRWPGIQARISLLGTSGQEQEGNHIGLGGYFAPHHSSLGHDFDSWAGSIDTRLLLPGHLELTGTSYRGLALGGLGGGAYKDFAYRFDSDSGGYYVRPLDDVGGWLQLKEKLSRRLEFNAAFGIDTVFAGELKRDAVNGGTMYQNLTRNRTFTGNTIYSPNTFLSFSLEYRRLDSSPIIGLPAGTNVIGLAAGYKF